MTRCPSGIKVDHICILNLKHLLNLTSWDLLHINVMQSIKY